MLFRRRIFPVFFFVLIGLMLLSGARSSAYRYGYFDGFQAAQTAVAAEADGETDVHIYPGHGYYGHHYHSFFGGFFRFIFTFFLISFLFKMFFRWRWYRHYGGRYKQWKKWHHEHGKRDNRSAKERAADDGLDYVPQDL